MKYVHDSGSRYIPECFLQAIGAHLDGLGTYKCAGNDYLIGVYGQEFPERVDPPLAGTVQVTRVFVNVVNPATGKEIHYDYNFADSEHGDPHVHFANSAARSLTGTHGEGFLNWLEERTSPTYKDMLRQHQGSTFSVVGWSSEDDL